MSSQILYGEDENLSEFDIEIGRKYSTTFVEAEEIIPQCPGVFSSIVLSEN